MPAPGETTSVAAEAFDVVAYTIQRRVKVAVWIAVTLSVVAWLLLASSVSLAGSVGGLVSSPFNSSPGGRFLIAMLMGTGALTATLVALRISSPRSSARVIAYCALAADVAGAMFAAFVWLIAGLSSSNT